MRVPFYGTGADFQGTASAKSRTRFEIFKGDAFVVRVLRLLRAERLERLWTLLGLAFYVSYCNTAVGDSAFAQRMGRRYKDGRKDLSWLSLAKCAELCGRCDVLFHPLAAQ